MTPDERLRLHQERSEPVMEELHEWLEAQLAERSERSRTQGWVRPSRIC